MLDAGKPMLVQTRFDIGVLVRLAGLDQSQRYPLAMRPCQHRLAGELRPIVGTDHCGLAAFGTDLIENTGQVIAADRMFGDNRH